MATKGSCYSGQVGERSIAISLYVCLCVSLSASIFLDTLDPSSRFLCIFPVAVARASSGGVAISVLWMTSRLALVGRMANWQCLEGWTFNLLPLVAL